MDYIFFSFFWALFGINQENIAEDGNIYVSDTTPDLIGIELSVESLGFFDDSESIEVESIGEYFNLEKKCEEVIANSDFWEYKEVNGNTCIFQQQEKFSQYGEFLGQAVWDGSVWKDVRPLVCGV